MNEVKISRSSAIPGIILSVLLVISPMKSSFVEELFNFEILGTASPLQFIPVILPPNYTGTLPPADESAADTLIIRLFYSGKSPCNLTEILLWQELTSWNRTQHQVTPPDDLLSPGEAFNFLVNVSRDDAFVLRGKIFLKLTAIEFGSVVLHSEMPTALAELNSSSKNATWISPILLFTALLTVFLKRERYSSQKKERD